MVFMEFDEPLDYFVPSHVGLIKEMVLFFYVCCLVQANQYKTISGLI